MTALQEIRKFSGNYAGTGVNHEGEAFAGSLELSELLDGLAIQLKFTARSNQASGPIFHREISTFALNAQGGLSLFNLNSNIPFLAEHILVSEQTESDYLALTFRCGDTKNRDSFREEIRLELFRNGRVGYHYSWGMPGGEFASRSGLILERA